MRLRFLACLMLFYPATCVVASSDVSSDREAALEHFFKFLTEVACVKRRKFYDASYFYDNHNKIVVRFFENFPGGRQGYKIFETAGLQESDTRDLCFFCHRVLDNLEVREMYEKEMAPQPMTLRNCWQHYQQKSLQQ